MGSDRAADGGARRPILLAVDGEPHTDAAIAAAARLASALGSRVTVLHVEDPYLKQFANEIYAQGREEYLAHVDRCLGEEGRTAVHAACSLLQVGGIPTETVVRRGDPYEVIRAEVEAGSYRLLIVGREMKSVRRGRRPRDLPARLAAAGLATPLLVVPGQSPVC